MLPKRNRVKREQFEAILKIGSLSHTPYFSIRTKRNEGSLPFAFAAVISKKVSKTAVGRNLLKRRARSVATEFMNLQKGDFPVSVILFFKKEGATLPFQTLKQEILTVLKKIRL